MNILIILFACSLPYLKHCRTYNIFINYSLCMQFSHHDAYLIFGLFFHHFIVNNYLCISQCSPSVIFSCCHFASNMFIPFHFPSEMRVLSLSYRSKRLYSLLISFRAGRERERILFACRKLKVEKI